MKRIILVAGLLGLLALIIWARPFFFMGPSEDAVQDYKKSPQFNAATERFQNPVKEPKIEGRDSTGTILMDFLFPPAGRKPPMKLPDHPIDLDALAQKSEAIRFAWLGHSTILLEMDGQRLLIDPVFSKNASPVPFTATRFQPPAWPLSALIDNVDVVLISHNHYDHLDEASIMHLAKGNAEFLAPLGVGQQIIEWGIDERRVRELDWWEGTNIGPVTLTASPSQHFSGRGLNDRNATLWASWSIKGAAGNVFFSGDSGYGPHYAQIGERLGPFDLTFLENGAYSRNWPFVHQLPEQAVQANIDLKGKVMVPIHWGMFSLGPHPWEEPAERVSAEAETKGVNLISPQIGQLLTLDEPLPRDRWWERLRPNK